MNPNDDHEYDPDDFAKREAFRRMLDETIAWLRSMDEDRTYFIQGRIPDLFPDAWGTVRDILRTIGYCMAAPGQG